MVSSQCFGCVDVHRSSAHKRGYNKLLQQENGIPSFNRKLPSQVNLWLHWFSYTWHMCLHFLLHADQSLRRLINIGSTEINNYSYIFERSLLKNFHERAGIFVQNSKAHYLIGDSAFRLHTTWWNRMLVWLTNRLLKSFPFRWAVPRGPNFFLLFYAISQKLVM